MKALSSSVALVIAVLAGQAVALAQPPANVGHLLPLMNVRSLADVQPYVYYLPNPGYHRYHAATAAEGYARGIAAMTYARGQYNRLTAEARLIHSEARGREIANQELATQTYFAMRRANQEARAAERGPRATQADVNRLAAQGTPSQLSPSELTNTGRISWPMLLQADAFAPFRAELEQTFAQRAANGEIDLEGHVKVSQTAQLMLQVLKAYIRNVDPTDYVAARRFIESLAYEATQPTG